MTPDETSEKRPHTLAVIGTLPQKASSRVVVGFMAEQLRGVGCSVDVLDFQDDPLPLFNPESSYWEPQFKALQGRVQQADVYLLASPDYHGSISSPMKNFLDHFWKELAGKLFATMVASHDKGLTVTDQLRTVARQCYAWTLPYGISFSGREDLTEDGEIREPLRERLVMMARDIRVYGALLARQRRLDLAGSDPGFLARLRGTKN